MVTGKDTNKVYLSDLLRSNSEFTDTCNELLVILSKQNIRYDFLRVTKDIWCRDYMPIQVNENKLVQFRYEPSYLNDYANLCSDTKKVCSANGITPVFTNINLDGGNVVSWSDRVIISDRVFDENSEYTNKNKLISELESLLEAEVIIIPQIKDDMTGHADGMVRFVDRNMILGNNRNYEDENVVAGINEILKEKGIEYIDVPFFEDKSNPESAIGVYVNYLEVKDLIVLPVFEMPGNKDAEAVALFKRIFPDRAVETINYNAIGKHGGLLNCTTWTVRDLT